MAWWRGARLQVVRQQGWCRALCSGADVAVFWDLNKCGVESGGKDKDSDGTASLAASQAAPNIVKSLRSNGFLGAITIRAYGNTRSFSNHRVTEALLATGVDLQHVCQGPNYLSRHLILDLLLWVRENSPPAHMLLISGEKELSSVLHRLHMRGYDVLLAHPEGNVSRDLCMAASKVWLWDEMLKGTMLKGTTNSALPSYNCPPLPQLDLQSNYDEFLCLPDEEVQPKVHATGDSACDETKGISTNIPQEVIEQILDIIRSKPGGFTFPAFKRQLTRSDVVLDKNFYGQRDLLSFMLSIPNLNSRLIWTSGRTRTFLFTENFSQARITNADERDMDCSGPTDLKIEKQES